MTDTLFSPSELPSPLEEALASEKRTPVPDNGKKIQNPGVKAAIPLTGKPLNPWKDSTVVRARPDDSGWDVYIDVPEGYKAPSKSYGEGTTKTGSTTYKGSTTPAADSPTAKVGGYSSTYSGSSYTGYTWSKWESAGIIVFAGKGADTKVLVCQPKGGYGASKFSLPKGKIEKGKEETSYQAAIREVWEETGVTAQILPGSYLGLYEGTSSLTHYYMGIRESGEPQATKEMSWSGFIHVADALNLLRGNPRDKQAVYLAYKRWINQ